MKLKRAFAFATCLALATAGCAGDGGASDPSSTVSSDPDATVSSGPVSTAPSGPDNTVTSDPNIDAQDVVDKFAAAHGDGILPAHDRAYELKLDMEADWREGTRILMDMQGQESASQKMSSTELTRDWHVLHATGHAPPESVLMIVGEEGDDRRVYAGRGRPETPAENRGWVQELKSQDETRELYSQWNLLGGLSDLVSSAGEVEVREEGGSYVIELVPSGESLEKQIELGWWGAPKFDDVSLTSGSFVLTVDKKTCHLQKIEMDYEAEITAQGDKGVVKAKIEGTFDDSQDVTIDLPQEAKDAPAGKIDDAFS